MGTIIQINDTQLTIDEPVTVIDILKRLNKNYKNYVAAFVNGKLVDLSYSLNCDGKVYQIQLVEVSDNDKNALEILRHSAAHITAQAVLRLYRGAKLGVGPPVENGYYYDIEFPHNIGESELYKIEEEIKKIVKENLKIERFELPKSEAIQLMKKLGQDYKIELLETDIKEDKVSFYKQGEFIDLCEGPHIPETSYLENIKLERITGAYWKGNEKNKMLQRIYGTSFFTKQALEQYFKNLEEQKKRDHRVLNKNLELYSIEEDAGSGLIFWHPNGAIIRYIIEEIWRKAHLKYGYKFVYTPHIADSKLWNVSGHLQYYKDNMYPFIELETHKVQLKPMNCPGHILIFRARTRSYRELPLR
ncbi:MAG: threonine--tRNA ligase, partial [Planctomycetota bacterium]